VTSHGKNLRSGELASQCGVSRDTLRFYERKGVLPRPVRAGNGYRVYTPEAVARVRMIRSALAVGFTVDDLAPVLKARDRGEAPCHRVRELAGAKLELLEQRRRELARTCNELRRLLRQWDIRLARTPRGSRAELLVSLAEAKTPPPASPFSLPRRHPKRGADQ
jgi:DNA-binding transcriptional MerR regulator